MTSKQENASRWLIKWASEEKKLFIFSSILTLLSAGCFVLFSWYLSYFSALWLNDNIILPHTLIYASVFIAGRYIFAHFSSLLNYKAGYVVVSKIKKMLLPKLLESNENDSVSSTLLLTRISDDLKPFYSYFIPYAISSVLVGILLLIICFYFEMWVGIILLIVFLVIPLQMIIIGIGAESLHKKHINLFMKYSAVFYNRLNTIAEIMNLDNLKSQFHFLSEKSKALNHATTSVMRIAILSSAVLELFVTIAIAAVAIYMGLSLLGIMPGASYGNGYNFHIALFMLMLSPYFFYYLRKFVSSYHDRNRALASAKLLMPLLNNISDPKQILDNENINSLEIKNLSFAYPNSLIKVLHDINIHFPTKGLVLVKGISGSGKSTLLKILSGSLKIQEGEVSINGHNNQYTYQWLKANSSYMNQYPFIFDGTLIYNVFLNKENDEFTYPGFLDKIIEKKEEGWHTILSHNGKQLSGGEKQLITLARMILYPKAIAILDEPTANLDTNTTEIIIEQISQLAENKLVFVASHEEKFEGIASTIINLNWGEQINYE